VKPEPQTELHLPDEERLIQTTNWRHPCVCGNAPMIVRKVDVEGNRLKYRVECCITACKVLHFGRTAVHWEHPSVIHSDPTPWFNSSDLAVRHWKLVAVLSRP
jgi:hypothetical protein